VLGIPLDTAILAALFQSKSTSGDTMSDQIDQERDGDGAADVKATLAIMAVVIYGVYFWLSGMPT